MRAFDEVKVWIGGDARPSQSWLPDLRFILAAPSSSSIIGHCETAYDEQKKILGVEDVQELVVKEDLSSAPAPTTATYRNEDSSTVIITTNDDVSLYSVLHEVDVSHLNLPSLPLAKIRDGNKKKKERKISSERKVVQREEITLGRCRFGGFRQGMSVRKGSSCL